MLNKNKDLGISSASWMLVTRDREIGEETFAPILRQTQHSNDQHFANNRRK